MRHSLKTYSLLLIHFFLLVGCVKDKPADPDKAQPGAGRKLLIANEGSLGSGNASLSVYLPDKDEVFQNVYQNKNSQSLGDIFQSMTLVDDRLFLAINNSDKIVVVDKEDFSWLGQIQITKPRNMLQVSEDKMYVSCLFYPQITIINPKTLEVTGSITTDFPNTEGLLLHQGKVYACNWDTACNYLYEIDPVSDAIINRIPLSGKAPQQVLADRDNHLWVLGGNVAKQTAASLTRIDLQTGTINGYVFPMGADMMKPTWNRYKDTLLLLGVDYEGVNNYNGVFSIATNADNFNMLQTPLIAAAPLQYFWALLVDSSSGQIYVGDPKGFIQMGALHIYDGKGQYIRSHPTGIGPGAFLLIE